MQTPRERSHWPPGHWASSSHDTHNPPAQIGRDEGHSSASWHSLQTFAPKSSLHSRGNVATGHSGSRSQR